MRQIGFKDAGAQFFRRVSNDVDRTDDAVHQLVQVERAAVGEVAFGQRPNSFVGVEVGSVGGKVLDVQARVSEEESGERGSSWVEELSSRTTTGPRRWRSNSRRNRLTSSCPILSKKSN